MRLQPLPLVVVEPARDADAVAERRVDEEAARQRDLGREPRALRAHRVLDRLDDHLLAARDEVLDAAAVALALELGDDDLVDVEEAVLLEADVDERGLHPRQDVVDDALVDVAGDRAATGPLEVDLDSLVVLEHGHALLADVDRDQASAFAGPAATTGAVSRPSSGASARRPSRQPASPLAFRAAGSLAGASAVFRPFAVAALAGAERARFGVSGGAASSASPPLGLRASAPAT